MEKALVVMNPSSLSSEECPTENVVKALLEYLVDPILPVKLAATETPTPVQQQQVSVQVHAVVLLYNYYYRKQHQELEFLSFESFSKLAVTLRPTLMAHMNVMHRSDYSELDDLENKLSLTEKAIMDACDISLVLDIAADVPNTEGWPITKAAVLLVDSKQEKCFLQISSITLGVWSVVEKDYAINRTRSTSSEGTVERKNTNKRKRVSKKPLKNEMNADEGDLQQVAFSAIKEETGIEQTDIVILESHVVYSLSKEKATVRFYIMQCTKPDDGYLQAPIKDVIQSLQGPLVVKSSSSWTVTPVVEYFHVLPYVGIVSDWLCREGSLKDTQDSKMEYDNVCVNSPQLTVNSSDVEATENRDNSSKTCIVAASIVNETKDADSQSSRPKYNTEQSICLFEPLPGTRGMDAGDSSTACTVNGENSKNANHISEVYHHQGKMRTSSTECATIKGLTDSVIIKEGKVVSMKKSSNTECRDGKVDTGNKICTAVSDQDGISTEDHALVPLQLQSKNLETLQVTLASKESDLSQTALRALLRKRDKLSHDLRSLEDEIAICDKNIQSILDGVEDNFAVKLEAVIDGCEEMSQQYFEDRNLSQHVKKKRFPESILTLQNPCQELDGICYENNWRLPTYRVSPSNGGFRASVVLNGKDFEHTVGSNLCTNPREARSQAATQMIAKLISTASTGRTP